MAADGFPAKLLGDGTRFGRDEARPRPNGTPESCTTITSRIRKRRTAATDKVLRITPERCTGCLRCELACSQQQTGAAQPAKSVIRVAPLEMHTSYAPYTCFQCAEAWCMTACPVDAITIDDRTGAKVVRWERCTGCKLCTIACPYGTIFLDLDRHKAFKCNLCGGDPACARACPVEAIEWVEDAAADWLGAFAQERAERDRQLAAAGTR